MPTSSGPDYTYGQMQQQENAVFGGQRHLVLTGLPVGQESLQGTRLIDAGALVAGTYYCRIPIAALATVNVQLTATFASGTATSNGSVTTYAIPQGNLSDAVLAAAPYADQTFTGVGSLTTVTRQTLTVTSKGEYWAIIKIVTTGNLVSFTQADYNGPRQGS